MLVLGQANNVGIGTTTPDESAVLDLVSTSQGLLPPRMTALQRKSIVNAKAGLIVWCSDCGESGELQVYNGFVWTNIVGDAGKSGPFTSTQLGLDIDGATAGDLCGGAVALSADGTILAVGAEGYDGISGSTTDIGHVRVFEWIINAWVQIGADIVGEGNGDLSGGYGLSISADGMRVAIGAPQNTNIGIYSGHVRVYDWDGTAWVQAGQDLDGYAQFYKSGTSLALSADGNTVIIGASEHFTINKGHVRVYTWNGYSWTQLGIHFFGSNNNDDLGHSVSISSDGSRIAMTQSIRTSGSVILFEWNGSAWVQLDLIIGAQNGEKFGSSVSLSADGNRIAIGASEYDGSFTDVGCVRVYDWNGSYFAQVGTDIEGEAIGDKSGDKVALSADGTHLVVSAQHNTGTGVEAGHARLYTWNGTSWLQVGTDMDGEAIYDRSGASVAISANGARVAIGAKHNEGNGPDAGHVRVYE